MSIRWTPTPPSMSISEEDYQHSIKAYTQARAALAHHRSRILEAVRHGNERLSIVPDELKNDRDIVLAAVTQDGWALRHASDELKTDREVVLAAVKDDGWSGLFHPLYYAHPLTRSPSLSLPPLSLAPSIARSLSLSHPVIPTGFAHGTGRGSVH